MAVRQRLAHWTRGARMLGSPAMGYGLSVVSVAIATGLAVDLQSRGFRDVETPLYDLALALTTWFAGIGPGALAVVLATVCFNYFFTPPLYTLEVSIEDLPNFLLFAAWAVLIASFVAVRTRIERGLRFARDQLQLEVEQRKQHEDEIRKLNQELVGRAHDLEVSNKELESFAYSVSHDLRAPLRHVIGYSELLQKHSATSFDEKGRRYMRTIVDAAKRMGNLIDDLLTFSRIGRAETRMKVVNLQELVKEVVAETGQDAKGRDIAWTIGPLPTCYGDRSMLKLTLVNLVGNAVKFTRMRNPATIEIGTVDRDDAVDVFVRDNGAGFDMRYADKLFGVFQRLHRAEEFEGTGIGLATVQRIVNRHGGQVRAEGAVEQGATFYFSLPKTQPGTDRALP